MLGKRALAPNLMTVFNLLLGFLAIIAATKGHPTTGAWLIIIAGICDVLDGKIARATAANSDFGTELDSLADVVSFGVAPAYLIYSVQLRDFEPHGLILSFLPLAAGAIRLARFNSSITLSDEKENFEGMPIPASAGLICSYVIFSIHLWGSVRFPAMTGVLLILCASLMVSSIEFDAMPKISFRKSRKNSVLMVLLAVSLSLILIFPEKALFPLAIGYILIQVGRAAIHFLRDEEEETLPDIGVSKQ